ncbi:MAG: glucose-1-phosphate adenylyltransferase subunit GlgD [Eubacteriales bacterium]|nr:glucose-1-phosphate adenylyltransferase subunit GlgD [Eubacteriales bacterium]
MARAFGIVAPPASRIHVEGLQDNRPISAFSFMGRYRVIDFPISNMSNSGIDRIQVYVNGNNPRSLTEHLGSGRIYNINSKRGKLQILFNETNVVNPVYNTDIEGYMENIDLISRMREKYVIIAPANMVYTQNFDELIDKHEESGADISLLYQKIDNARERYLNSDVLVLNKQKGVLSIDRNQGNTKEKNLFMETYVMEKDLFLDLIRKAKKMSSIFTLAKIVKEECAELDVRGIQHKGFLADITDIQDYYDANLAMLDIDVADSVFAPKWPIYTHTTDSCPTQYFGDAEARNSFVANGCQIEGVVENSVIGRGVKIHKGAVVKNSVILAYAEIGEGVRIENQIIDKWARVIKVKEIVGTEDKPGYIRRDDIL